MRAMVVHAFSGLLLAVIAISTSSCIEKPREVSQRRITFPQITRRSSSSVDKSVTSTSRVPGINYFCVARIPFSDPGTMVREHQKLMDCLAKKIGRQKGLMVTAPDYEGVLKLLLSKRVDAAWMGTVAYVRARMNGAPIEPIVCPLRHGRHFYRGVIICRKDSHIKQLADLKGKRFAFVEPSSASGHLYPRMLLTKAGLRLPRDFETREHGQLDFLGKHDTVVLAVYLGKYDAGAVYNGAVEDVFRDHPEKTKEICVLAKTQKIFNEPIVVRAELDRKEKEKIKEAFLSLRPDRTSTGPLTEEIGAFAAVTAGNYDPVIEALNGIR